MAEPSAFATACRDAARGLRRMPADLRRHLGQRVKPEVADPLADDIRGSFHGPYARALSAATKTRVSGDPKIVIGGARRVVSGGASGRDLVFGDQFGGGRKEAIVSRRTRSGRTIRHRRHTTRQFPRGGRRTVFPTIDRQLGNVLERFARIVGEVLDRG